VSVSTIARWNVVDSWTVVIGMKPPRAAAIASTVVVSAAAMSA
jgi:hypothetical protein